MTFRGTGRKRSTPVLRDVSIAAPAKDKANVEPVTVTFMLCGTGPFRRSGAKIIASGLQLNTDCVDAGHGFLQSFRVTG